ncbi:hypothetical protein SDC9_166008 [bioreactor metagenome]|uniref:Uncharacterized protein n=1 Tax=bioreactor metagenome TaxID=1076179 RepID=A0A645FW12_9ZZZZ
MDDRIGSFARNIFLPYPVFITVLSVVCHHVERGLIVDLMMQFRIEVVEIKTFTTVRCFVYPFLQFPHEQIGIGASGRKGERGFILYNRTLHTEFRGKQTCGNRATEFLFVAVFGIDIDDRRKPSPKTGRKSGFI